MIYAMAEDASAVKIGSTSSSTTLKSRLIQLQQGNHRVLSIVALADGAHDREKSLHALFSIERIRGEWFRREGRVERFLAMHAISPLVLDSTWPADAIDVDSFVATRDRIEREIAQRQIDKAREVANINRKEPKPYTCSRCSTVGHTSAVCYAPSPQPIKTLQVTSPFTKASRKVRDPWGVQQWSDWRQWMASRRVTTASSPSPSSSSVSSSCVSANSTPSNASEAWASV